jgi:S-formylglutathione hydrolase
MAKTKVETTATSRCFGGEVSFHSHPSEATGGEMRFSVYTPPQALDTSNGPVPVLYYLAGLTCTEETFQVKAGAQSVAAEHGLMLVSPDTSPRDAGIPGEDDDYDFGTGAGFYLDAEREPYSERYRMYSYVTSELPRLVKDTFSGKADTERQGIFGHSMGGHGALVLALRNPELYRSVSAFAPAAAPTRAPWGEKAFSGYLGEDREKWKEYDASELVRRAPFADGREILIDQGTEDGFLEEQLYPHVFEEACKEAGQKLTLRRQEGYDHGYYFISTFMEEHIQHHAEALGVS